MTLLVLSDSHGSTDNIAEAYRRNRTASAVLFLGDGLRDIAYADIDAPIVSVRGNCDFFGAGSLYDPPTEHIYRLGEYNIMLMHGHTHGVKGSVMGAAAYAARRNADILLFGHTHIPYDQYIPQGTEINGITLSKPLRIFNPGSIGRPMEGAPSFGIITIKGSQILLSHGKILD